MESIPLTIAIFTAIVVISICLRDINKTLVRIADALEKKK
jgi:hypothetical protein